MIFNTFLTLLKGFLSNKYELLSICLEPSKIFITFSPNVIFINVNKWKYEKIYPFNTDNNNG